MLVPGASGTVGVGTTTATPGVPAGMVTSQEVLAFMVTKKSSDSVIATPTSWTDRGQKFGGSGSFGANTGPTRIGIFSRTKDTGWSTMPAFPHASASAIAVMAAPYLPAAQIAPSYAVADGTYDAPTTPFAVSSVMGTDPGIAKGDRLILFAGNQDEAPTWSAQSLSVPGCVLTPVWERSEAIETTSGNDCGGMVCEWYVKSGTSTGAATFTATASAASTGPVLLLRVRESIPANLIEGVEPEAACGFSGPIVDGNGNLYRVTEGYLGVSGVAIPEFGNHPGVYKSTDGGVTWNQMDSANSPGYGLFGSFNDMESCWVVKRPTRQEIEICFMKGESRWWGCTFQTSDHATAADTWLTSSIGTSGGVETFPATIATESGISAAALSDGTVRAFVRGQLQSGFDSFSFRTKATTTWSAGTYITDGRNMTRPSAVTANSDIVYLFYRDDTNAQVRYRTIDAAGTVGASARVDSGGAGVGVNYINNVVPPVYYDDAGTPVVVVGFVNASNVLRTVEVRGGVVGSEQVVSTDVVTVNPQDLGGSSTDSQGPAAALAVIGTTLYAFWGEVIGTSGDVYYATRTNGGSWSARQLFYDTGAGRECQWLYANALTATKIGLTVDIGRHFDDDSNIFYASLETGAAATRVPFTPNNKAAVRRASTY